MKWRLIPFAVALAALSVSAGPADAAARSKVSIHVLSGRADLVSGHSALVRVDFSRASDVRRAKVKVGKRSVRRAIARSGKRHLTGVVRGLRTGPNTLRVTLPSGAGARITLTDHPISGPVLSGPQLKPWKCQDTAKDANCNQPASFTYVYKSSDQSKSGFQPYDPKNPPSDVATTTTDRGVTVPFIVRVETGYIDRDQYQIAALFQPGKPWTALAPQRQFNHKLLITHGVSCGVDYQTGTAPDVTGGAAETA